jgi:SAM-dependent methyltransferase
VSFDRAAAFYDRTRSLPPATAAAQTSLLLGEVERAGGPVLEIGVGTGRIALPLARAAAGAGARVAGIDVSAAMLARLREKDAAAVPVVCADATRLPFAGHTFGVAIASHVLHLIPDWAAAVEELRRVLRPAGVLLVTRGRSRAGLEAEIASRIRAEAGAPRGSPGLDDLHDLDRYLSRHGAGVEHLPPIANPRQRSAEYYLAQLQDGVFSWIWDLSAEQRRTAVAAVREWLWRTHGDPATVTLASPPVRWHRYRLGQP